MITRPHPDYKNSQVDWLGDIPSHWQIKPLFAVAEQNRRPNKGMVEDNLLSLSYGRIIRKDISRTEGLLPESFETYQVVEPGDIVFRLTDLQNDKRSLRSGLVEERGIITSAYLSVRLKGMLPRFFAYAMRDTDSRKVFYSMGGGLRQSMKYEDMRRLAVVCPPLEEQRSIADYLDHETAEIETFIADQEELIGLLNERRAATVTQAVTKGVDPKAQMKDSGITWLGEVPAHWDVHSGRRYFAVRNERAREGDVQLAASQEYGVIEQQRYVELTGNRVVVVQKGFDILKHVESGDFVISMRSFQGGLEYSALSGQISSAYVMLAPVRPIVDEYFKYLFKSSGYISALRSTSNLVRDGQALRFANFAQVPVAVPPLEEQQEIAAYIKYELSEIDAAINDAREAIALSKERRVAVIAAAVTGKIDLSQQPINEQAVPRGESVGVA